MVILTVQLHKQVYYLGSANSGTPRSSFSREGRSVHQYVTYQLLKIPWWVSILDALWCCCLPSNSVLPIMIHCCFFGLGCSGNWCLLYPFFFCNPVATFLNPWIFKYFTNKAIMSLHLAAIRVWPYWIWALLAVFLVYSQETLPSPAIQPSNKTRNSFLDKLLRNLSARLTLVSMIWLEGKPSCALSLHNLSEKKRQRTTPSLPAFIFFDTFVCWKLIQRICQYHRIK